MSEIIDKIDKKDVAKILGGVIIGLFGGVLLKSKIKKILDKTGLLGKNAFAGVNAPQAGARTTKELQRGNHPIQLYSMGTPNGNKVTILLEELGLKYDAYTISIMKGDQFTSGFVAVNPNSKIPALVDYTDDKDNGLNIFESGNILLHFAEKTGKFIPKDPKKRTECLNWLFMQMGSAPYFGQYGHFHNYAPKGIWHDHTYAHDRYAMETQRITSVLDMALKDNDYLCGDEYTIADMAWYPWINCIKQFYKSWDLLDMNRFTNVVKWVARMEEKPAVKKGMVINQPWNDQGYDNYHSEE